MRQFRYLDVLITAFVVILLVSNLVAQKIIRLGPFGHIGPWSIAGHLLIARHDLVLSVSGALLLFPLTYIFGDVFTEVYGYAASRRAIWLGFCGTALMWSVGAFIIALPADPDFHGQQAFIAVFGILPRLLFASLIAFWAGEFANSYTMARLKILTRGRWLWTRTVSSTIIGQAVDTIIVVVLTFAGNYPASTLARLIVTSYFLKVAYEVLATPLTYLVVNFLKRTENSDAYDAHTNFNPFTFFGKTSQSDSSAR